MSQTRAQQFEILAAGVIYDGSTISTPYVKFLAAGTSTAKDAYADIDKAVAITKKALDTQGRATVYGDGIYKLRFYSGDPDAGGVFKFELDNQKVTAVSGNARTITSNTTGTRDDGFIIADTTSGNITYTLPSAADYPIDRPLTVKKVAAGNIFTYAATGSETIDGNSSGTLSDENATIQFLSNGTNWFGAQIVGTASTLGGYAADTGTTADTIPVRDGDGKLPGDILGSAAKVGVLNVKVVAIGDWNMDTTSGKEVAHGIADHKKIRIVSGVFRNDADTEINPIGSDYATSALSVYIQRVDSLSVSLVRSETSSTNSTDFDSTSYNRGWLTIHYID